jgi:hypothetical protein
MSPASGSPSRLTTGDAPVAARRSSAIVAAVDSSNSASPGRTMMRGAGDRVSSPGAATHSRSAGMVVGRPGRGIPLF